MDNVLFCSFVLYWMFNEFQGKIYFSGTDGVKSYDEAVAYCDQLPGRLLPYGKEVVKAAKNNGMSGLAWVGKPWFKNVGCFYFDSISSNVPKQETANVSSYVCASYCRDYQYLYMGMTITHCFCFKNHNETAHKQVYGSCRDECPGNKIDNCGNQKKVLLLQKVNRMRDDVNDTFRQTFRCSENGVRLRDDSAIQEFFFFCEYSFKDVATMRTIENTSVAENEIWNGLTIGVVVGVIVIVIFVIGFVVCVYCKLRNKKAVGVKEEHCGNPCIIDATVGIKTAYENPWSDQEPVSLLRSDDNRFDNNVYDHASHKVFRENNDLLLYDVADVGNEEYNITAFGKQHVDPGLQQIKSNNYQLNDYDTCASEESEEMKTK